ncbi:MAG TPA: hypothetical protein VFF54_08270 [Thermodesulfobacteriota bacterium]|nr:hypothetical protein [Thermodesulfobacteriota bacterium]
MAEKIFLVSYGEYGDLYVASLASSLKEIRPEAIVKCIGAAHGHSKGGLERELESEKPDCIVLADQSVFDFHLMEKAKTRGIPVVDYAGAAGRSLKTRRLVKLRGLIDRALAVFPFETAMYKQAGVDVEFVGHPLVDIVDCSMSRTEAKAALGYDWTEALVALIPGDGGAEETMERLRVIVEGAAEAAAWSSRKVRLVIPDAEKYEEEFLNGLIKAAPRKPKAVKGQRQLALRAASVAVIGAGTATVEAALSGAHMLIIRKTLGLSYYLSNFLSKFAGRGISYGLPNIILGRPLCPELVQKDVTAKNITIELGGLLESATKEETDHGLAEVRAALGEPGTVRRAAEAILRVMR